MFKKDSSVNFYRSIVCVTIGLAVAFNCHNAMAQIKFQIGGNIQAANAANAILNGGGVIELTTEQMQSLMELRIEEMNVVCELSDVQVKKLGIMAKVAVKGTITARKEFVEAMQKQIGKINMLNLVFGNGGKGKDKEEDKETFSDEDEDKSQQRDKEAQAGKPNNALINNPNDAIFNQPCEQQEWQDAVKQILTSQQQIKLSEADKMRRSFRRRYRVLAKVDQLDFALRLTATQRVALTKTIDKTIGKSLEARSADAMQDVTLQADDLKEILTEKQLAVYQDQHFEDMANQQKQGLKPVPIKLRMFGGSAKSYFGAAAADSDFGVELKRIKAGSPADSAGLKAGDIIQSIDGQHVDTTLQFRRIVGSLKAGKNIQVKFLRDGENHNVKLRLGRK